MKTVGLILLFAFAVPSSQTKLAINPKCVEKYTECLLPVINNWGDTFSCSAAKPLIKCMTTASAECDPNVAPTFEYFGYLTDIACPSDVAKKQERNRAGECVMNNTNSFRNCIIKFPKDTCSASRDSLNCTILTMYEKCGPSAGNGLDKILGPIMHLAELCVQSEKDADTALQCLMSNAKSFRECSFKEDINTVGDVCSSVHGFILCILEKSKGVCSPEAKDAVRNYTMFLTSVMRFCNNVTDIRKIPLEPCLKAVLTCNIKYWNVVEHKCTDLSNYVGCLADASGKCVDEKDPNPLYFMILQNYKNKFPEYCDKDSSFNKNMEKEGECIDSNTDAVAVTCFGKLQKDQSEELDKHGILKAYVNYLLCITGGFREKCNKEAEDAVNDLLHPLRDSLDESCRLLTGKRCNNACGLKVATWIFIASLVYLLTRRYE